MRVLVVEDVDGVRGALVALLERDGHQVTACRRGQDALHQVAGHDLVLLDLGLPDMHGLEVLAALRRASSVPVIICSASDSDESVVQALRLGADDYMIKPISWAVLVARIDAVVRRLSRETADAAEEIVIGDLAMSPEQRTATLASEPMTLTRTEYDVLAALAQRAGQVVSREELHLQAWGTAAAQGSRSLDYFIGQIRSKLGGRVALTTVRGFGYRLGD